MPDVDSQFFPFAKLPTELRLMIYSYALLPHTHAHRISRDDLPPLHTMRFRYNHPSKMLQERCAISDGVLCNNLNCRSRSGIEEHIVEAIELSDYAFGLFYTSRAVSAEARAFFYGQIHFVFDNRFDLHIFLEVLQETASYIKSLTFSWPKSEGPHSIEIKEGFKGWSLQSESSSGPELSTSIRELAVASPRLEFLEMIDTRPIIPARDKQEFKNQPYKQWTIVKEICRLGLKRFTYPSRPISETTDKDLDSHLRQLADRRASIVSHVNSFNTRTRARS